MERTYTIIGMSCEHCVAAVDKELRRLVGVSDVRVSLVDGQVTLTGNDFADDQVEAAVTQAGYAVASR